MADEPTHPDLEPLATDDTVRVTPADADRFVGTVDDIRKHSTGAITTHAVTVAEDGHRAPLWDLTAEYDPREGWSPVVATKRVYGDSETEFVEHGEAEFEVIDLGIDPDRLGPGITVEAVDGHEYRVVIPPWEREYDSKALAYDLDSKANTCEKLRPREVIRRVE
ncbi:hypothetical protein [Halostella litorea]|uniref:hypothetical protein n=1 Tax=Halostella litorea TaxID=2528831 RepID=UPI0010923740|nr:hypothetical protein [Halostella litorea]